MFTQAIARMPGENAVDGLTTAGLGPPDIDRMLEQHTAYVDMLRSLGLTVTVLDPLPDFPDAHFVEDTAVVTTEIAVVTRPGADARQGEQKSIVDALSAHRKVLHIIAPGTLDGGDVLQVGTHFFIGISERTNEEGAVQLGNFLTGHGATWTPVIVGEGLHLKSGVNHLGDGVLLVTAEFAGRKEFAGFDRIVVPVGEEYAANTLRINGSLLMPAGFPGTRRKLEELGLPIIELDTSEARKMDGGLTCLSLRF